MKARLQRNWKWHAYCVLVCLAILCLMVSHDWQRNASPEPVTEDFIAEGSVGDALIAQGFVGDDFIAEGFVGDDFIAEGSIAEGSIAEGSIAEGSIAEGSFAEGSIAEGSIAEGSIAEGSIAEGSIAEGSFAEGSAGERLAASPTSESRQPDTQSSHSQSPTPEANRVPAPPRVIRLPPITDDQQQGPALPPDHYLVATPDSRLGSLRSRRGSRSTKLDVPDFHYPKTPFAAEGAVPTGDELLWCQPEQLLERLAALMERHETGQWATDADRSLRLLAETRLSESVEPVLGRLRESVAMLDRTTSSTKDAAFKVQLRNTSNAFKRQIDVWQQVARLDGRSLGKDELPGADGAKVARCLDDIDNLTADSPEGAAWREYVSFDELRECNQQRGEGERLPRELAQRVTKRLTSTSLSPQQRKFLSLPPLATLLEELRKSLAEPVDSGSLLAHLEGYETSGLPSDGRLLAKDCCHLALSTNQQHRKLAYYLEHYYRGPNLRLAVAETLLNRLMPQRDPETAAVNDTIMGHRVRGKSLTDTEVAVKLQPDPKRVLMALQITGRVDSLTRSSSGPATFYNNNLAKYTAIKPLRFDLGGIHLSPAEIKVYNNTRLRSLKTDFDGVPLLGALAREIARSQHDDKRMEATNEIRGKVARKARQRIDSESQERLGKVSDRLQQRVLLPLDTLLLNPQLVDAETTEKRFKMRLRLAGDDQLGANTPRPWAPTDSLASFQLHQSAVNNLLDRLNLAGQKFTMPQLAKHVTDRLNLVRPWQTNPSHDDVKITFAKNDPVTISLQDGKATLKLSIARLSKSPRVWKDFQVRIVYRPTFNGRSAELARDSIIHLKGERLSTGAQIALRAIFSKTFPKQRPLPLLPERLRTDPNLADLGITQAVIIDGWLGLALGPQRTARRPLPLQK